MELIRRVNSAVRVIIWVKRSFVALAQSAWVVYVVKLLKILVPHRPAWMVHHVVRRKMPQHRKRQMSTATFPDWIVDGAQWVLQYHHEQLENSRKTTTLCHWRQKMKWITCVNALPASLVNNVNRVSQTVFIHFIYFILYITKQTRGERDIALQKKVK